MSKRPVTSGFAERNTNRENSREAESTAVLRSATTPETHPAVIDGVPRVVLVSDYFRQPDIVLSLAIAGRRPEQICRWMRFKCRSASHSQPRLFNKGQRRTETTRQSLSSPTSTPLSQKRPGGPPSGELMMYLQIFLKVCEGCGSLWFRAQDSPDVYCPSCAPRLTAIPPSKRSRRSVRRGLNRRCTGRRGVE